MTVLKLLSQEKERGHFSQWVTEDIAGYIARKRQPGVFGNNIEIQACIELYNRPCEVYSAVSGESTISPKGLCELLLTPLIEEPLNIFQTEYQDDSPPIRLSYHNGNHYNSVIDPLNPSVGVGLGLPNLQPGVRTLLFASPFVQRLTAVCVARRPPADGHREARVRGSGTGAGAHACSSRERCERSGTRCG